MLKGALPKKVRDKLLGLRGKNLFVGEVMKRKGNGRGGLTTLSPYRLKPFY
jgi:hypothetical protein